MLTIQVFYALCMIAMVFVGLFCASRLTHENPLWVRLITLSPAISAMGVLGAMAQGEYVAYSQDIFMAFSIFLIYALVASRFTDKPWLDIRVEKHEGV